MNLRRLKLIDIERNNSKLVFKPSMKIGSYFKNTKKSNIKEVKGFELEEIE